jgi:hypothetical protein
LEVRTFRKNANRVVKTGVIAISSGFGDDNGLLIVDLIVWARWLVFPGGSALTAD